MRILLVAPDHPFETTYGLGQRIQLVWRALRLCGDVDLLVVQEAHVPSAPPAVENLLGVLKWKTADFGAWNRFGADPELVAWKEQHLDPAAYGVVVSLRLAPLRRIGGLARVPAILDFDDADHLKENEDVGRSVPRRMLRFLKDRARTQLVKRAVADFDWVWFTCENDQRATPFCQGDVLPNIPFGQRFDGDPAQLPAERVVLWVGALTFGPNFTGVQRFLERGWPAVRAAWPDARLRLVGRADDDVRRALAPYPGVEVLGFVADLDAEYAKARFTIAPVNLGGGTNIKVLESFARGRTCVVTPFSHYGYERVLADGEALLVAADERTMAEHCIRLLGEPSTCTRLARTGQAAVAEHHSFERFAATVARGIRRVTTHPARA